MADIVTLMTQIPETIKSTWHDMGDGTHALVVYALTRLVDGEGNALSTDSEGALTVILYPHHEVHSGRMYQASYKSPDDSAIADNASLDMLLVVGSTRTPHIVFAVAAGGDVEVLFYEDTTVSNAGTALVENNMNRTSNHVSTVAATHTPTVSGVGTLLADYLIPGGQGPRAGGGTARESTEWILEKGKTYLIRATNRSGGAQPVSITAQWYEEA
jgi:hypothetical protein